ncbi:MAG: hypothetical protein JXX28_15260 [Deltaproteobacteria bacterium]|nr:hypothetical protein [Deltaproteobacteria bacterium]
MWKTILIATGLLLLMGAASRLGAWLRRTKVRRRLLGAREAPDRMEALTLRLILTGGTPIKGMSPLRAHRTGADLILVGDHLVVSSNRGVLLDTHAGPGASLRSVRSPGPGRLILEGVLRPAGAFRMEAVSADPAGWVRALAPFTLNNSPFGSLPEQVGPQSGGRA